MGYSSAGWYVPGGKCVVVYHHAIMGKSEFDSIQTRAEQGREFEESEKREWRDQANVFEEHAIEYPPGVTNGRIDVYIDDGGFHSI
ncbi:MAG: hypothetical protein IIA53_03245, partial [Chloroflexi bacterium]|nr:hypothetical protein [Chloroflexota bacterium]